MLMNLFFGSICLLYLSVVCCLEWNPRTPPVVDFFVRTHIKDVSHLAYMLRSVDTFVDKQMFRNIIIGYNIKQKEYLEPLLSAYSLPIVQAPIDDDPRFKSPYHAQMYQKIIVHKYTDADFIVNIDSDCMFYFPVNLSYIIDEKNRVYVKAVAYKDLDINFHVWKKSAEPLLGFNITHETMTRFPIVYPTDLYPRFIQHVEEVHKQPFLDVFLSIHNSNEFTPLGAFLMEKMPDRYSLETKPLLTMQLQSHRNGVVGHFQAGFRECLLVSKGNIDICARYDNKTFNGQF